MASSVALPSSVASPMRPAASASASAPAPVVRGDAGVRGAVCGGLGAMVASACTQPLDLLKVRLQLLGELNGQQQRPRVHTVVRDMLRNEGVMGFYRGLSASLFRQAMYSPARFGFHHTMMSKRSLSFLSPGGKEQPASALEKLVSATASGATAGLLSTPADLVMVRMQADGRLARSAQRGYSGIFSAFQRVVEESGARGLFRGAAPNMQRAALTTMLQFVSYDKFKSVLRVHAPWLGDGLPLHLSASLMAGGVVAVCACPIDVMRTRMMNSKKDQRPATVTAGAAATSAATSTAATAAGAAGPATPPAAYARAYSSTFDCLSSTLRTEGIRGLYKGFMPYYARVGPQVTLMFVFYEQLQSLYDRYVPDPNTTR